MKNKFIISIIILIAFIMITISCIFLNKEKNSSNLTTIKLAEVTHSVFYTPLYIAIENGYFKEYGIDIDLILTPGADKVSAAILSGDANVGFAGAESVVYVYESGEKDYLQIFSGLTAKDGQFIVSRKKIENFTLADLEGKEIIVGRSTGMPALNFMNSLLNNEINTENIEMNTSIDFAAMTGAFISGTGDYINVFEPNATILENEGYGYVVANVGELSGEVPYTTFYAKSSYINNNEELLKNFTKAIDKAIKYTYEEDSKTLAEDIIKQFPDTNINDLALMIERYKDANSWLENPLVTEKSFKNLENFLIRFELLNEKTSYENIVKNLYE